MKSLNGQRHRRRGGFTLVEILVAASITVVLVGILLIMSNLTSNAVRQSSAKLTAFATSRTAFDLMTQKLSQATLNTYLDYYGTGTGGVAERRTPTNASTFKATAYGRASDLQFIVRQNVEYSGCGQEVYFQAPQAYSSMAAYQSVQGLLNVCGYYVTYSSNAPFLPTGTMAKYRYRLMQGLEPTEDFNVFSAETESSTSGSVSDSSSNAWLTNVQNSIAGVTTAQTSQYVTPLADNVIALVVWPRMSEEDDPTGVQISALSSTPGSYLYDSQYNVTPTGTSAPYTQVNTANTLPPCVQVTMVVLDEASMLRLEGATPNGTSTPPSILSSALLNKFTTVANYTTDLTSLIAVLSQNHLNFQVFNATVPLRESKWSTKHS